MNDGTPTERFATSYPGAAEQDYVDKRKPRALRIILFAVIGALVLAMFIVFGTMMMRGNAAPGAAPVAAPTSSSTPTDALSPSSTATASNTPTPTVSASAMPDPVEEPDPVEPDPVESPAPTIHPVATINSFAVGSNTVICNSDAPGGPFPIYLNFSWSSSNVDHVYFGADSGDDASVAPLFTNLPPSGDNSSFPFGYDPFEYPCSSASHSYTLTVVGSDGHKDSRTIVVQNIGDTE